MFFSPFVVCSCSESELPHFIIIIIYCCVSSGHGMIKHSELSGNRHLLIAFDAATIYKG